MMVSMTITLKKTHSTMRSDKDEVSNLSNLFSVRIYAPWQSNIELSVP